MESVCFGLGDELYPAFLHILCIVGQHGDQEACDLITDTLVQSLLTGRLPSGKQPAWGASRFDPKALLGKTTSLGPVEYLFIWHSQPSAISPLPIQSFQQAAFDLLSLISSNKKAKDLYCTKLRSDIDTPLDGYLSSKTKNAIRAFVDAWETDVSIRQAIDQYLEILHGDSLSRLVDIY
jgi:phage baseplate assembly protein W